MSVEKATGIEIEPSIKPVVGIIMGSKSDRAIMAEADEVLLELDIPHSMNIISAHRTPELMKEYARTAKERGLRVIIAGAGGSAHLPGMTASETLIPVVAVPIQGSKSRLNGLDALLSQVQMPPGIPVAVMAINGAKNAALYVAQWLANDDPDLYQRLIVYRQKMKDEVIRSDEELQSFNLRRD